MVRSGKLLMQPGLGNQVGGQRRATEEADWANVILCRPFRDSILSPHLPGTSVPGSGFFGPSGTRRVAESVEMGQIRGDPRPLIFCCTSVRRLSEMAAVGAASTGGACANPPSVGMAQPGDGDDGGEVFVV